MSPFSWINLEFWGPVWPNLVASAICFGVATARIRVHLARHRDTVRAQTEQQLQHHHDRVAHLLDAHREMTEAMVDRALNTTSHSL